MKCPCGASTSTYCELLHEETHMISFASLLCYEKEMDVLMVVRLKNKDLRPARH